VGNQEEFLRLHFLARRSEHFYEIVVLDGFLVKKSLYNGFENIADAAEMRGVEEIINIERFAAVCIW
jgi:hypothetical protein